VTGVLIGLAVVVLIGSTVPVLPTGAAVSAAAVVGAHHGPLSLLVVVAVGAIAAYGGDAATYAACRTGGQALVRRLGLLRKSGTVADSVRRRIEAQPASALLVSRLLPGGRIPVLLTAAVVGLSWRRFATANSWACLLWSAMYATIGLLGRSVFPEPWQGVVAAVLLVVAITQLIGWIRRRREAAQHVEV
jgi:membrane protein DedA with SNARE-associated domain